MRSATAAAEYLDELRQAQTPVAALPEEFRPRTLAEGYEIQARLVEMLLAKNHSQRIGYKIACTSELAQKALGVDGPFFGVLMTHSTKQSPAKLRAADFTVRCTEAEFAFEMGDDVPQGRTYDANSIRDYIASALPSIEVVDHRYRDWKTVGAPSLLADNAIHGAWVPGAPYAGWHPDTHWLRGRGAGQPAQRAGLARQRAAALRRPAPPRRPRHHGRDHRHLFGESRRPPCG
jgi:2-keto-4-pentenoate hydratase